MNKTDPEIIYPMFSRINVERSEEVVKKKGQEENDKTKLQKRSPSKIKGIWSV
jgi:hypothetical protein